MLRRCRYLLVDNGLLFVTIPRACVVESRCITHEQFLERLNALGFVPYPHDLPEALLPSCYYLLVLSDDLLVEIRLFRIG